MERYLGYLLEQNIFEIPLTCVGAGLGLRLPKNGMRSVKGGLENCGIEPIAFSLLPAKKCSLSGNQMVFMDNI